MRFKIYLSIEGNHFDPAKFNAKLDKSIIGEIVCRKKTGGNNSNQPANATYWRSKSYEVTDPEYPEDRLLKLIRSMANSIQNLSKTERVKVSAHIVEYIDEADSPRGFYLSHDLVQALAQLDADMDTDIVHDLKS
ncbi:MAG: hypothetical protein R3E93_16540 [Thiothrix sp.]